MAKVRALFCHRPAVVGLRVDCKIQQDEAIIRRILTKAAKLGLITAIVPDRYCHDAQIQ